MEIDDNASALKKIRFGMLEPELQKEVLELAGEMGYEVTLSASSNLHFLLRIYEAEKVKEKRGRQALKRAEEMILRLSSLHHASTQGDIQRSGGSGARRARIPLTAIEGGLSVSSRIRRLFESIGITDDKTMEQAVGLLGERKIEERVEYVHRTSLGDDVVKKVFGAHPQVILIPRDEDFLKALTEMEKKKQTIDGWAAAAGKAPPPWADYRQTPGVLLAPYQDILRQLSVKEAAAPKSQAPPGAEGKRIKFTDKPMRPSDFIKVMEELGFSYVREATHGPLYKNENTGDTVVVARGHKSQKELNESTIKRMLAEAHVELDQFELKRRMLKL
jgi:predicted RNA binding protein YcfA (HicA-like mRNA interferase family)